MKNQQKIVFTKNSYLPFTFVNKPCDYVYEFNSKIKNRICNTLLKCDTPFAFGVIRKFDDIVYVDKNYIKENHILSNTLEFTIKSRDDIKVVIDSANAVDNVKFILSFVEYPIGLYDLIMSPVAKNNNVYYKFSSDSLLNTEDKTEYIYMSAGDDTEVDDDYEFNTAEKCLILNIDNILNRYNRLRQNIAAFEEVTNDFNIICRSNGFILDVELAGIPMELAKSIYKKIDNCDISISTKNINNVMHFYLNLLPMTTLGMDKIDITNIACFIFTICELMTNRENSLKDGNNEEYNKYSKDLRTYIKDMRENLILPLKTKCKIKNFSFKKTFKTVG